ncbi:MAG: hypothetical protein WCJ30_19465 [Deltaproteobacteria bacterium]
MVSADFLRRKRAPRGPSLAAFSTLVSLTCAGLTVHAQVTSDRSAAAEAYDNGTRRFLQHDYAGAANWFETANRMAPSALAMGNAVRAHQQAGGLEHLVRAATLSLRLQQLYADDAPTQRLAQRVIEQVSPHALRVVIHCAECEIESDGVMQPGTEFFAAPGPHALVGHWAGSRTLRSQVDGAAGQLQTVALAEAVPTGTAIASSAVPATPAPTTPVTIARRTPERRNGAGDTAPASHGASGLRPGFFIGGLVATAAFGGAAIWSWLDATSQGGALIAYARTNGAANPTMEASVAGAETRTIALDAVTGVFGAATVAALVFTRWSSTEERPAARVAVLPALGGVTGLSVVGSF